MSRMQNNGVPNYVVRTERYRHKHKEAITIYTHRAGIKLDKLEENKLCIIPSSRVFVGDETVAQLKSNLKNSCTYVIATRQPEVYNVHRSALLTNVSAEHAAKCGQSHGIFSKVHITRNVRM